LADKVFERLEPCAGKIASTVLRGRGAAMHPSYPAGYFEDKMKIGNRKKVTDGYKTNPKWLKTKDDI